MRERQQDREREKSAPNEASNRQEADTARRTAAVNPKKKKKPGYTVNQTLKLSDAQVRTRQLVKLTEGGQRHSL